MYKNNNDKKHFQIFCDGGFANRYSCLIGGLTLSRLCGYDAIVNWGSSNTCRAKFYDIFSKSNELNVNEITYKDLEILKDDYVIACPIITLTMKCFKDFEFSSSIILDELDFNQFQKIINSNNIKDKNIFYSNPYLPDVPKKEIYKTIEQLEFDNEIINNVNKFIDENNLSDGYNGIHIRMTDFDEPTDIDYWFNFVKNLPNKKYFICSDDPEIELKFGELPNTFSYPKKYKTEKYIKDGEWRQFYVDEDGRRLDYNVERGVDHVKEAIVDFILLSFSNPHRTATLSTFFNMAIEVGSVLKDKYQKHYCLKNMKLKDIHLNYNTDKGSGHNYLETYDNLFSRIRENKLNILEIGVLLGGSLKMWENYFPNSMVYGIDDFSQIDTNSDFGEIKVDPENIRKDLNQHERIKFIEFNSRDYKQVRNKIHPLNIQFDIIIDDADHLFETQIDNFNNFIGYLSTDGIYVIEDCESLENANQIKEYINIMYSDYNVDIIALDIEHRHDDILMVIRSKFASHIASQSNDHNDQTQIEKNGKLVKRSGKRIGDGSIQSWNMSEDPISNLGYSGALGINIFGLSQIVDRMGKNNNFVDLGVQFGDSSLCMSYNAIERNNKVYGVDVYFGSLRYDLKDYQNYFMIQSDSVEAGKNWNSGEVSILFIDTMHVSCQVLTELYYWYPHVKEGGYIIFHDTAWPEGRHDLFWVPEVVNNGIKFGRPEFAVGKFFGIHHLYEKYTHDGFIYEDDDIEVNHNPDSWGMTFVKIKKKRDYISEINNWNEIFDERNKVLQYLS